MTLEHAVELALPEWVTMWTPNDRPCPTDADKVAAAIALSRRNVEYGTGGPFGTVVFGPDDRPLAVAVNCVVAQRNSLAHAEIMAIMLAQRRLRVPRLNSLRAPVTLATSSQPCCQCFGALFWAGIDRLLIGARAADVIEHTAFDEGPLPEDWLGELRRRGIDTVIDLHRDDACRVLRAYGRSHQAYY